MTMTLAKNQHIDNAFGAFTCLAHMLNVLEKPMFRVAVGSEKHSQESQLFLGDDR